MNKENNILIILAGVVFVLILVNLFLINQHIKPTPQFKTCSYINKVYTVTTAPETLSYSTAFNPITQINYPIKYKNKYITNKSDIIIGYGNMCR